MLKEWKSAEVALRPSYGGLPSLSFFRLFLLFCRSPTFCLSKLLILPGELGESYGALGSYSSNYATAGADLPCLPICQFFRLSELAAGESGKSDPPDATSSAKIFMHFSYRSAWHLPASEPA
jgi:hypothetical protein